MRKGTIRHKQAASTSQPSASTKTDWTAQCLQRVGILALPCLKTELSACLAFGHRREPHRFSRGAVGGGGLFRKRGSSDLSPNPALREPRAGNFSSQSGQPQQMWRDCIGFLSTVRGWLWAREGQGRPGYMASGLGGSLKSLAADMSFLMCLSSVMPAS